MNKHISKENLRRDCLEYRREISGRLTEIAHKEVCGHIIEWVQGRKVKQIFMYYPIQGEPDLRFICEGLNQQVGFGLPVIQNRKSMFFYSWKPGDKLKASSLGIPEPVISEQTAMQVNEDTLILVPCLAVDTRGTRLGYGGGYYDRFLANTPASILMGVVWDEFFSENDLPSNDWDVSLHYVATEAGIFSTKNGK